MDSYEFYKKVREILPDEEIDFHEGNIPGFGDLYIKKTRKSSNLIRQVFGSDSVFVTEFNSQKAPFGMWYEIVGAWSKEYETLYAQDEADVLAEKLMLEISELKSDNARLRDILTNQTIVEKGSVSYSGGRCDINTSSIVSRLIREAGRWCEHYASDLFILWNVIQCQLDDGSITDGMHFFAFRESGVDTETEYIRNNGISNYYRAVWVLEIQTRDDSDSFKSVTMSLTKK